METVENIAQRKFIFLESIDQYLLDAGLSPGVSNTLTFIVACAALLLLIWLLKIVGSKLVSTLLRSLIRHTESKLDSFLLKRKFYKRLINFVAAVIVKGTSAILFQGFGENALNVAETIIDIYLIYVTLLLFNSIMNTVNDVYETKPQARIKPIRSIVQSAQIIAGIIAGVLIIAILVGTRPGDLLLALGASAAIFALIFRDTILAFIASLQISAQDMIRPGDWVEMPSRSADGLVDQINVMNIKVRNWDNSVSMIPTYALISESFTNWRNMQESSGRRFKKPLLIDVQCLGVLSDEKIGQIRNHPAIDPGTADRMMELMAQGNTSTFVTNAGLYRCYVEAFLDRHPKIARNHLRVVRYLDNTENGMVLQVYAYSTDKALIDFERVVADIFEHIQMVAPLFDIRFYQRPAANGNVSSFPDDFRRG